MALTIGELTGYLRLNATAFARGVDNARRQLAALRQDADQSSRNLAAMGAAASSIGRVAGIASLASSAVALGAAVVPATGALIAGASAAVLAGGAFAALSMGTQGVGDALSALADGDAAKAAEALAELSPSAREAVTAMDGVRESFGEVQQAVQEMMFSDLAGPITQLGGTYLPILRAGLVNVAGGLNQMAASAIAAAQTPFFQGAVASVLAQTGDVMETLAPAAGDLLTTILALAQGGMGLVQSFATWAAGGLAASAAFLQSAEGAAWMAERIAAARLVLSQLGAIIGNLTSAIGGMFGAANVGAAGLLPTLVELTAQFATWANSAQGQEQLSALFSVLHQVFLALLGVIPIVSGALLTLVGWFAQLPGPVQTVISSFLAWSLLLGALVARFAPLLVMLARLAPMLLSGAGSLVLMIARWGLLGTAAATSAAATNASALSIIGAWLRMALAATVNGIRAGLAWLLIAGPQAAVAAATMAASAARIVAGWVAMAVAATANAARTALAWLLTTGPAAAMAVATMAATAARFVAGWALMAVQSLARAAMVAASWLIAMGPIGWIIAAVVALVALIIANWDRIRNATVAAWNAVSNAVSTAAQAVVGFVQGLVQRVVAFLVQLGVRIVVTTVSAWARMRAAVGQGIAAVVSFVSTLPGRILAALARLGSLLVGVGGDLLRGLWRGISNAMGWLLGQVRSIGGRILSAARSALGIGSPSKYMADQVGRWIPAGVAVGVDGNMRPLSRSMQRLGDEALGGMPAVTGSVRAGAGSLDDMSPADIAAAVEAGVGSALASGRMTLRVDGRGVARLVNRQNAEDRRLGSARVPAASGRR